MKVRGKQQVDVELDDYTVRQIVRDYLSKRYQLFSERSTLHMVRDGKLIRSDEYSAGSHSYDAETVERDATPFDEAVLRILRELRS